MNSHLEYLHEVDPHLETESLPTVAVDDSLPCERSSNDHEAHPQAQPGRQPEEHSSIQLYLRELGQFPLLTRAEEIELARRIQRGDAAARQRMILSNLRLVVTIARDFTGTGMPLLDLVSAGNMGLMRAVDRFDPENGAKLSVYAAYWIKQQIRLAVATQARTVRLPVHLQTRLAHLSRLAHRLHETLGREPGDEELAAAAALPVKKVRGWRVTIQGAIPLDEPQSEDGLTPAETLDAEDEDTPAEQLAHAELLRLVSRFMGTLKPRERAVIEQRFGLGGETTKTLEEIATTMGITRERVRQIQNDALARLRKSIEELDAAGRRKQLALQPAERAALSARSGALDHTSPAAFGPRPVPAVNGHTCRVTLRPRKAAVLQVRHLS